MLVVNRIFSMYLKREINDAAKFKHDTLWIREQNRWETKLGDKKDYVSDRSVLDALAYVQGRVGPKDLEDFIDKHQVNYWLVAKKD